MKTSEKLLVWFPKNSPEFPHNSPEFPWNSPEFPQNSLARIMWNPHFQIQFKCHIHKIGLMLRYAVGYTCEVRTAQETGESWGISRNHWEIRGNWGEILGKFGENWWISGEFKGNWWEILGKLVENWWIAFPQWWNRIHRLWNQFSTHQGKRGEMRENCFTNVWNRWGKWKGSEREFRFHDQFQLHSTV